MTNASGDGPEVRRLQGLLRANQTIVADLALPVVLRRIAEAARELIGAEYAALGVIAPDGHLSDFVHLGMDERTVERIGRLPQGKGLLGALIEDPRSIRLDVLGEDDRSCGFPPGHPPMRSFLGVPIRVRGELFGNLYLAESTNGRFSAEDTELAKALAAAAGVAIDNARLYEAARTRGEWLAASAAMTRHLLSVDVGSPLQFVAERSHEVARADLVTIVLPTDDGLALSVAVAVGTDGEALLGVTFALDGSLPGQVLTTGEPLRAAMPAGAAGVVATTGAGFDAGPLLIVPLVGSHHVHGVLSAVRARGRPAFTAEDLELAAGFANQASVAIELAEARSERQAGAMIDERDRIAIDLHDHVIARLFGAGLSAQSIAATLGPGAATDRLLDLVGELDDTIRQIRTTIFQLQDLPARPVGDRERLLAVVEDVTAALGFAPTVRFTGVAEGTLPRDLLEDLLAVLREALSNVFRHARARSAAVDVAVRPGRLVLVVSDDGVGLSPTTRRSGLSNLRQRAERRGGTLVLTGQEPTGTCLAWSVPIA